MPTEIPIYVEIIHGKWRIAKTEAYEVAKAIKQLLLLAIVERDARSDFEYIIDEVAGFAKRICETTEFQWFCLLAARLERLYTELVEKGE